MTNSSDISCFLFIDSDLKQQGPTTAAEMKYLVSANLIKLNTYVWKEGMSEWLQIQQIPDLHSYLFPEITNLSLNLEKSKNVETSYSEVHSSSDSSRTNTKQRKNKKKIRKKGWIYVTGLPADVTIAELHQHFSKAGLIQEDALTSEPLIKIYYDETGKTKGDCSVGYVKPESVELALSVLDEGLLRVNDPLKRLKITYAEVDSSNLNAETQAAEKASESIEKKRKRKGEDWETAVQLRKLKQQQLLSWNEEGLGDQVGLKVVIIKNLYNAEELEEDTFCNDLLETLGSECSKLGLVKQITFFERNPEGIAKVRFDSSRAAEECVRLMNGRWFDKRQLEAFFLGWKDKL